MRIRNPSFFALENILENLKVLNSLQHFREAPKHSFVSNFLLNPRQFFIPTATKITCNSPFYPPTCGVKPAQQLRFLQKPDSAFDENLRFVPVQNIAVRFAALINFAKKLNALNVSNLPKISPHGFWTAPRSPEGRNPLVYFWVTFSYKRKSNIKTVPYLLFRNRKSNIHQRGSFSEKEKLPLCAHLLLFAKSKPPFLSKTGACR